MTEAHAALSAALHEIRGSSGTWSALPSSNTSAVAAARLARAVSVSVIQNTLVCVSAFDSVTSVVDTMVEVSTTTMSTVATWVAMWVTVCSEVEVTVMGPLGK